ncbi:GAF and ANTAR domain-containing protein [Streptomyces sp. NPDC051561]|uniref:GAF and ANTAR domain-containing protein n=1 Tax=Streptomyces sp. NPDC051561 TaxID=3365658 RepID=UPI00378D9ED3
MDSNVREQRVASAFVELADTLLDGFDVIDFLQRSAARCVELLDVSAAGLMLVNQRGQLQGVASSAESSQLTGLLEVQQEEGPCLDCFRTGTAVEPVLLGDPATVARWPLFAPQAAALGNAATYAVPLRLREQVIGALNLFVAAPGPVPGPGELELAQAFADAATIGILQQRTPQQDELLTGQLQSALSGRVRLDQAKGMVAERWGISVDEGFDAVRAYARSTGRPLSEVATALVQGTLEVSAVPAEHHNGLKANEKDIR